MDSAYVETDMAVETDAYKQAIDFPVGWSTIVGIQAYNTVFENGNGFAEVLRKVLRHSRKAVCQEQSMEIPSTTPGTRITAYESVPGNFGGIQPLGRNII